MDQTDLTKGAEIGLTNALQFVAVLALQTCSLSIALGAPWRETIYFTFLVLLQVLSGVITWMHLRSQETAFSLPKSIVFGFALSYGVVGICQLILQPLIPNAHLVSVFSPVVLAIVLTVFRQRKMSEISIDHGGKSVLYPILFAAPMAMSFSVIELIPIYILPLLMFLTINRRFSSIWSIHKLRVGHSFVLLSGFIVFLSVVFYQLSNSIRNTPVGMSLLGDDELFDFAHSRGYTLWGISENINFVGDNIRLYKFAQVWLGTLLESVPSSVLLTSTLIPVIFFTLISLALWSLTFVISESPTTANIGAIIIFLQASLPEPYMIERRPLYLISALLIVVGSNICLEYITDSNSRYLLLLTLFSFVFFSTRIQYATLLFVGILTFELLQLTRKTASLRSVMFKILCIAIGSIASFFIFYQRGIANTEDIGVRNLNESLSSLANSLGFRVFFLLTVFALLVKVKPHHHLLMIIVCASVLFYVFAPGHETWRYPIEVVLIASAPLLAVLLHQLLPLVTKKGLITITSIALSFGFANRVIYDLLKWRQPDDLPQFFKFLQTMTSEGLSQFWFSAIQLFVLMLLIALAIQGVKPQIYLASAVLLVFSYYFGVLLATDLRAFTSNDRISTSVLIHSPTPTTRWIEQDVYSSALNYFVSASNTDDIFATNAHKYDEDYARYGSSLIITSLTGRRSYAEAPNFDRSTPSDPKDEFFVRTRVSIEFPNNPSASNFDTLKRAGVKWFIIDLDNTEVRNWEPWAKIRFINNKVAVLELADESVAAK
ncbi:MAG: hypothetical protein ACKOAE_09555 [Acidimicrobiaceae bacterium]